MDRRTFIKNGLIAAGAVATLPRRRAFAGAGAPSPAPAWRRFEVTTKVELLDPTGVCRVWLPLPLLENTDYFRRDADDAFTGNAATMKIVREPRHNLGMFYAEWPAA